MKKEEQLEKLFEALTGLDYGTWLRLKRAIDMRFNVLLSINTLMEESVRRVCERFPRNRTESTMQEFKCKKMRQHEACAANLAEILPYVWRKSRG